jgi:hypothetical protein
MTWSLSVLNSVEQAQRYYSDSGRHGAIRWSECFGPLKVLAEVDDDESVGTAYPCGPCRSGLGLYRLEIDGKQMRGRYFCVNREFVRLAPDDPDRP